MRALLLLLASLCLLGATPTAAPEPVRLAVLYFENQGNPQLEMLKVGLAQMLISDLSAEGRFDVVERTRINELLAELDLQASGKVDAATAAQVGKLVGARYLVLGGYFELMGQLRVDARVVDVETSRIVSVGQRGAATDLWSLESRLVVEIAGAVAESEARRGTWDTGRPPATRQRLRSAPLIEEATDAEQTPAPPKDPMGAAIAFSEGLDFLDRKDLKRARDRFQRALELDATLQDAQAELSALAI